MSGYRAGSLPFVKNEVDRAVLSLWPDHVSGRMSPTKRRWSPDEGERMGERQPGHGVEESRDLSTELARMALERAAPDELLTFDEVAEEYYADRRASLRQSSKDEPVGFGLELALLAPFALAVAEFVLGFIGDVLKDVAKDAATPAVSGALKRMLKRPADPTPNASGAELTSEQRSRIFAAAKEQSTLLGLDENKAVLLSNAIVGVLGK